MNVLVENFKNRRRIWNMAVITVKQEFVGAKLGIFWEVIRIAVFFTIYALFYGLVRDTTGNPTLHLLSLFSVLLPWNLISAVINQTPRAYYKNRILVSTIKFPLGIIPTFDIVSRYIIHLITIVIVIGLFTLFKHISFTFILVLYYYFCLFVLLLGMMFILSLVCSISNDVYKFWQVIARVFIYINPIFWQIDQLQGPLHNILIINPFVYILEGFRHIMAYEGYIQFGWYGLYFWVITLTILGIGIVFQKKLRKVLPDVL